MATIAELALAGDLIQIDVPLEQGELSWRRIFATPAFVEWLDKVLPTLESTTIGADSEPHEQIDAVFHDYVIGEHMVIGKKFKRLKYNPDLSVWELKTSDVRVFGWVPAKDVFICAYGDLKDEIELKNAYGKYIAQTHFARTQMNLDDPKVIESKEYYDVLSDAD
jgi:hypothetical protein